MTQEEYKEEARRLRPRLLQTARRYLNEDDAEDTVQDVLLRLWQMVDKLRMPIDSLAMILVRNFCVDRLRRLKQGERWMAESGWWSADETEKGYGSTTEGRESDERIERVLAMIDTLPTLQQTILRLRHIEGMEMREIAELTGSSEVAIRKTLSRARQTLKQQYEKRYE
jgi:RNA polymerase sigma-70 factor (ECF subfamily)